MIHKIRVDRATMRNFPFDIFYFVPFEHRAVIPRMLPWSLCIPLSRSSLLYRDLDRLRLDEHETIPLGKPTETCSFAKEKLKPILKVRLAKFLGAVKTLPFVVIPVLPQRRVPHSATYKSSLAKGYEDYNTWRPGYITAWHHIDFQEQGNRYSALLDERTVLFTPKGPISPPCACCSRFMLHLQEKCSFGSGVCYDTLVLKRFHPRTNREEVDEQLREDDCNGDLSSDTDTF